MLWAIILWCELEKDIFNPEVIENLAHLIQIGYLFIYRATVVKDGATFWVAKPSPGIEVVYCVKPQ